MTTTMVANHRLKAYFYSALSALFFFVILRQIGLIEQRDLNALVGDETFLRSSSNSRFIKDIIQVHGMSNRKTASEDRNYNHETSIETLPNHAPEGSSIITTFSNTSATSEHAATATAAVSVNSQNPGPVNLPPTTATSDGKVEAATPQNQPQPAAVKPPIYTFFTGVQDRASFTGMNVETDNQLLQTWKDEWSRAGWNPVVLTLETAKQHSDFNAINALVANGPFGEYDRYCFLRWLAVSVVGGGFAADYDMFPLSFVASSLPNGGKLTVHESSKAGGVPSLVSANAEEYTRFAWLLARNLDEHKKEAHWSDMKAMQDIYKKSSGTAYIMDSNALTAFAILNGRGYDDKNCARVARKYALHFSHYAVKHGKLRSGVGPQDRAGIGSEWLKGWRENCRGNKAIIPSSVAASTIVPNAVVVVSSTKAPVAAVQQSKQPQPPNIPPIYTFYTGVENKTESTGMNDAANIELLQTWKKEWTRAGWNPIVVTLETAKQHPDYQAISALLAGPFGEYDRYCFLRWLAVAVAGGGFAVDYDTFPLDFVMTTLPNGGKLTVHENSRAGGVPSLISASAQEYTAFAWALAGNLGEHQQEKHWSDMKAMQDMYQKTNGAAYIMESNVLSALVVLNGQGFDDHNCAIVRGKYALHFSHHAIQFGKLREGVGPKDRAGVGSEWLNGWRQSCKQQKSAPKGAISSWFTSTKSVDVPPNTAVAKDERAVLTSPQIQQNKVPLQPPVYTFFTGVQDRTKSTGMNDDADDQLLQAWKQEWSRAGWNPVVLSLETAKQHPDFEAINALLTGPFGEYDRYCFLRWLAVAVAGGGFAVDYDTFPLDFVMTTLPNGGKLTVHENSRAGGVPSLVSASAQEYTAFAWALARNLGEHQQEKHWSDMKAMQDMYQQTNGTAYVMESNVLSALVVLNGQGFDAHNCGIVRGKYALHFSHHAIEFGKLRDGVGPKHRADIGREWLKGWHESCKTNKNLLSISK